MSRSLRIGLIAEGEAELGPSVPYLKPEEGGKPIDPSQEGALHTLIRRELAQINIPDCQFIHRHPSIREQRKSQVRRGHSILEARYLAQMVIAWQPEEIDLIVIVVDADDVLEERKRNLAQALATIRDNHIDPNGQVVPDRSAGGLAIQKFETWLLGDPETVAQVLGVALAPMVSDRPSVIGDFENLETGKEILEDAIAKSTYVLGEHGNQRPLHIRWDLAQRLNLEILKINCPSGYQVFVQDLLFAAKPALELSLLAEYSNRPEPS
jgi:hypothetical protein